MILRRSPLGFLPAWVALLVPLLVLLLIAPLAHAGETVVSQTLRITPTADSNFSWPYYLFIPAEVLEAGKPVAMLVVPNNTGTGNDDPSVHDLDARKRNAQSRRLAERLGVVLLVPAFPRPASSWQIYTHALDRDTLLTREPKLVRIDRQLIAMIDDAAVRLATQKITVTHRVLMRGHSASAMFANRFAILHPDRVLAVVAGSPGGWPLAPVSTFQKHALRYPIGIGDLQEVAGSSLDIASFKRVQFLFQLGGRDTNDSVPYKDGYDPEDKVLVFKLFGATPVSRWAKAKALAKDADCKCQFKLYPGIDHTPSDQMDEDAFTFLRNALEEEAKAQARSTPVPAGEPRP